MSEPICKNCTHWRIWWTYCPFGDCAKKLEQKNELETCENFTEETTPEANNEKQMPLL